MAEFPHKLLRGFPCEQAWGTKQESRHPSLCPHLIFQGQRRTGHSVHGSLVPRTVSAHAPSQGPRAHHGQPPPHRTQPEPFPLQAPVL